MINIFTFVLGSILGAVITCIVVTGEGYRLKINKKVISNEVKE